MKVLDDYQDAGSFDRSQLQMKSRLSLMFNKDSFEKEFNNAIESRSANFIGMNFSENYSNFNQIYFSVTSIYLISYILSFSENYSHASPFIFRSILILSISLLYLLFIIISFRYKLSPKKTGKIYLVFYSTTFLFIILNTDQVINAIFKTHLRSDFNSILGALPFIYSSKFSVFKSFRSFLSSNLAIQLFYLFITLLLDSKQESVIIEFLLLFAATSTETIKFYYREKDARDNFLITKTFHHTQKHSNSRPNHLKTDIEEISKKINETLEIVESLSEINLINQFSYQKVIQNLIGVIQLITTRNSVYSIDVENLGKLIDDEEKTFIKEITNNVDRPVSNGRVKPKKSAEVLAECEIAELPVLLRRIGKEWNFDIFHILEITQKPLFAVADFCFKRYHIDSLFQVPEEVYQSLFKNLEDLYKPNPYHNSSHAADVLCSYFFFIRQSVLADSMLDWELFSVILSCAAHDVGHPALTNRFLINSKDHLAVLYNDISVLENMHCSTLFKMIQKPDCNVFTNLAADKSNNIRALVIDLILSTDMAKHFDLVGKFKSKTMNSISLNIENLDLRNELLRMIMKACDVGHAAKALNLHQSWTSLVVQEFFHQGDLEKSKNLPVSMYCDRETTNINKSQTGFIKNIVMPIYDALDSCLHSKAVKELCIDQLETNLAYWSESDLKRGITHENKTRKNVKNNLTVKAEKIGKRLI